MSKNHQTLAAAFVDSASRFADRVAVRELDGTDVTYAALQERVGIAVSVLRDLGCRPGDRVAIWLPNRTEWSVLTFAAALLGLCIVPINTRYRPTELVHAMRMGRAQVLVT
jgi:acyl-CoA synthetase (AMP-forming)/AMP-acid ligase II